MHNTTRAPRRSLGVGLALAIVLAACSGTGGEVRIANTADGGAGERAASESGVRCRVAETDGELLLLNWTDYMDPALIEQFKDEFAVDVVQSYYASSEEALAVVQEGAVAHDIVIPSDYMVGIMIAKGLLLPLDADALPNRANLDDAFVRPPFDPDLRYHAAFQWGTTGLGLDVAALGDDVKPTWGLVFAPDLSAPYAGRISMLDSPRDAMGAALQYLGYPLNSTDEAQVREAADLVADARSRITVFDSDNFEDLLVEGETVIAQGYSGDFASAFAEADGDFRYVIPEEGAVRWVDAMVVPVDAPHPCTAHAFINFILDAENGATLTNWTYFASPNEASREFIDAEILEDPAIYPPPEVEDNLEFVEDTGETETLYTDLFAEAKG